MSYQQHFGMQPTDAWYVIHCQPRKEHYAARALQEQRGLAVYVPEVISVYARRDQYVPLFPRYIFAHVDLQALPPSLINATPGVVRLVAFDEHPQSIPEATMRALRQQVHLLNNDGGLPEQTFQLGDAVQIKTGPLRGLDAIFVGPTAPSERVQILLEFMGRLNEVEVERGILTTPCVTSIWKRSRQTRGKGRKIRTAL